MTEQKNISRRAVAKGVAWGVPAVAVVAAAPMVAASPTDIVFNPGNASTNCKSTGAGKGCCPANYYQFNLVFKNEGNVAYTVAIAANQATASPSGCESVTGPAAAVSATLNPGDTKTLVVCAGDSTCNANGTMDITFTYTYTGPVGGPVAVTKTAHWASVNPCDQACA